MLRQNSGLSTRTARSAKRTTVYRSTALSLNFLVTVTPVGIAFADLSERISMHSEGWELGGHPQLPARPIHPVRK